MLTIDDLGRAAWDAEFKAFLGDRISPPNWDHLTEGDRRPTIFAALAAVERFAEEVAKELRQEAEDHEDAVVEYGLDRRTIRDHEQLRLAALTAAEHIEELLSSLRDEAGQVK